MSERIRGSYDDALYKLTYTVLYYATACARCLTWYLGKYNHTYNVI